MVAASYEFHPVRHSDLGFVRAWLCEPHVRRWWGDPETERALIAGDIGSSTKGYIVHWQGRPFAYIQSWIVAETSEYPGQPEGTLGVDPFIGVPEMTGIGHGARFIAAFVRRLFEAGARRVIIDPDPHNTQALRAYLRAGFVPADPPDPRTDTVLLVWDGPNAR